MEMFPMIDIKATGKNIVRLRKQKGISVKELQAYFGFEQPQAIYKWQWGDSLPSVDNLFALSKILEVSMQDILVESEQDIVGFMGKVLSRRLYEINYTYKCSSTVFCLFCSFLGL